MSELIAHMEREFRAAGLLSGTDPQEELIVSSLRQLMGAFASQGHSGGTGHMVLNLFDRLASFKPLVPLTGDDREWHKIDDQMVIDGDISPTHQNKRCSSIFKYGDGRVVDVSMVPHYVDPVGVVTTRSTDRPLPVTFPYMPGFPEMIRVDHDGNPIA